MQAILLVIVAIALAVAYIVWDERQTKAEDRRLLSREVRRERAIRMREEADAAQARLSSGHDSNVPR